jgi:serine/threonine protein kinase
LKLLDRVYLVLEFVEMDMKHLLNNQAVSFRPMHLKVILYNMLCCLNFLHSTGIMHRDIKPSNFLLTSESTVKLCDFGLARSIVSDSKNSRCVTPIRATRYYRSPEVILLKNFDLKTDIWGVGCVFYELIKY